MAAPKSPEAKAAAAIVKAVNLRGLNNGLIAYFIGQFATKEVQYELLDIFLHLIKDILDSPIPDYFTADDAAIRVLADSVVRAVEDSGHTFRSP